MTYELALRHHVERSLRRDLGLDGPVEPDDDGDYGVVGCDSIVWVRPMLEGNPALVRVWSIAACGVKRSMSLLSEINDINGGLDLVRVLLRGKDTVVLTTEVEIEAVTPGMLGRLVHHVGYHSGHVGELITTVHGGERPFVPVETTDDADHAT
jgi:hypothetical protein